MQAVKNMLHSSKDKSSNSDDTASLARTSGQPRVGDDYDNRGSTASQQAHNSAIGTGLTGDHHHSSTGTGLTGDHHSSSTRNELTGDRHSGTGLTGTLPGSTSSRDTSRDTSDTLGAVGGRDSTRYEENRSGHHAVTGNTGDFADKHTVGHDHSLNRFDPNAATTTHDHKHLQHVTHRNVREVEVEEVERQKEIDIHQDHVQLHVQPVIDKQVRDEVRHENIVPVTTIKEKHASTEEDRALLAGLANREHDSERHLGKERTVVDLGEKVHETVHHHVHHVTQPVIEQEVVERERIHTVIPTHQITHEAPIIHKASVHEPVTIDNFLSGQGKLDSNLRADQAGLLNDGSCERQVEGVGEKIAESLHLKKGTTSSEHAGSTRI